MCANMRSRETHNSRFLRPRTEKTGVHATPRRESGRNDEGRKLVEILEAMGICTCTFEALVLERDDHILQLNLRYMFRGIANWNEK